MQAPEARKDEEIVPPGTVPDGEADLQRAPSRRDAREPYASEDVTLELDADIIAWFKGQEDDHETAINAALREHVQQRQGQRRSS
jgi:uncharacterized protein (DUF4415 family)